MKHAAILKQYLIYQKNSPPKNDTNRDVVIMKCAMHRNYRNYNAPTKNTKWDFYCKLENQPIKKRHCK